MSSGEGQGGRGLSIAIFYSNFIYYHVARCLALKQLMERRGGRLVMYALRPQAPDRPASKSAAQLEGELEVLSLSPHINSLATVRSLWRALNRDHPDAVVIPGYRDFTSLTALGWCKLKRRGAILLSDTKADSSPRSPAKEWCKRKIVALFDGALAAGSYSKDYIRLLGLPQENIFQGADVVDNDYFSQQAEIVCHHSARLRKQYGLPERYFLCVSRYIEVKNIPGLLQAYARYRQISEKPPWSLVLCGSGYLEPILRDEVERLKLEEVHFAGYKQVDELPIYYGLAAALVLPSVSETWGLVVNEAMASGLPVLVSRACGCAPDLVQEGVNGFIFDPYDAETLARLMLKISSGEVDLASMGQESRRIIQDWTLETFAENLLKAVEAGFTGKMRKILL